MTALDRSSREQITAFSTALREVQGQLPVLSSMAWPAEARETFLAGGAQTLPQIEYPELDLETPAQALYELRNSLPEQLPFRDWLDSQLGLLELTLGLLQNRGQPRFTEYSQALFGAPTDPLPQGQRTPLELAEVFTEVLGNARICLPDLERPAIAAETLAGHMQEWVTRHFGDLAPSVELVDELSAKALAGRRRVRIRRDAAFSEADIGQLAEHELGVHVATALNGDIQTALPMLGASHAGSTRTQEGLAVFSEFITGNIEIDRLERLANRVTAIQMALDGADFIEVYRWFRERESTEIEAFENTRRIFRGGVINGGAPFTKDGVYLDGLLRVHNLLRTAVAMGRADIIRLLFCGKLDLDDIPTLAALGDAGLLKPPRFLPDWVSGHGFLIGYLAYSGFLNAVNLDRVGQHYRDMLDRTPTYAVEE